MPELSGNIRGEKIMKTKSLSQALLAYADDVFAIESELKWLKNRNSELQCAIDNFCEEYDGCMNTFKKSGSGQTLFNLRTKRN